MKQTPQERVIDHIKRLCFFNLEKTGRWPTPHDFDVWDKTDDGKWKYVHRLNWSLINKALIEGRWGLPGRSSLEKLERECFADDHKLSLEKIVQWCSCFYDVTGRYPTLLDDDVWEKSEDGSWALIEGQDWYHLDQALYLGLFGLDPGGSLDSVLLTEFSYKRTLTLEMLVRLARLHFEKTGHPPKGLELTVWDKKNDGEWFVLRNELWRKINLELKKFGEQIGLPSSLADFNKQYQSSIIGLTNEQIVRWFYLYVEKTGKLPNLKDKTVWFKRDDGGWGRVYKSHLSPLTWPDIDTALKEGLWGLNGGTTLEQLALNNCIDSWEVTRVKLIRWCQCFHKKTGRYPTPVDDEVWDESEDGELKIVRGQDWYYLDQALYEGVWGLKPGSSLDSLLLNEFSYKRRPTAEWLTRLGKIHFEVTGHLPRVDDETVWDKRSNGELIVLRDERWDKINEELKLHGDQLGLPCSLLNFNKKYMYPLVDLNESKIVDWCFLHYERTGKWPTGQDNEVWEKAEDGSWRLVEGESWKNIKACLRHGHRGLYPGNSLLRLKNKHFAMTKDKIARWCEIFMEQTGKLPSAADTIVWDKNTEGDLIVVPNENWDKIDQYLIHGRRGMEPGGSLRKLKLEYFSLSAKKIARWCYLSYLKSGDWPTAVHEPVWDKSPAGNWVNVPGLYWDTVNQYLVYGRRGLKAGGSLAQLKQQFFGAKYTIPTRPAPRKVARQLPAPKDILNPF